MTDEEKLNVIKNQWKHAANSWGTLQDFKDFLDNVTKQKVKNFLKNKVQDEIDKQSSSAQHASDTAQALIDFKTELDIY